MGRVSSSAATRYPLDPLRPRRTSHTRRWPHRICATFPAGSRGASPAAPDRVARSTTTSAPSASQPPASRVSIRVDRRRRSSRTAGRRRPGRSGRARASSPRAGEQAFHPVGGHRRAGQAERRDVRLDHRGRAGVGLDEQHAAPRPGTAPRGPTAPEPAYRSSTRTPSGRRARTWTEANSPSLARSLVGRVDVPRRDGQPAPARRPGDDPCHAPSVSQVRPCRGTRRVRSPSEVVDRLLERRMARQLRVGLDDRRAASSRADAIRSSSAQQPQQLAGCCGGPPAPRRARRPRGAAPGRAGRAGSRRRSPATASSRSLAGLSGGRVGHQQAQPGVARPGPPGRAAGAAGRRRTARRP